MFNWTFTDRLSSNHSKDIESPHDSRLSPFCPLTSSVKVSLSSCLNKCEKAVVTWETLVGTAPDLHSHSACQWKEITVSPPAGIYLFTEQLYRWLCRWLGTSSGLTAALHELLCDWLPGCRFHWTDSSWWINKKLLLSQFRILMIIIFIINLVASVFLTIHQLFRLEY